MTRALTLALGFLLMGIPARAQERPAEPAKAQQPAPRPERQEPPAAQKETETGQPVNIRLDIAITDQQMTGQPVAKNVSMVVADNWQSRIRTEGNAFTERGPGRIALNVDARPRIVGDKILLIMTVEYKPSAPEPKPGTSATTLNQSCQVLLTDGKPLVISQSADPDTDRKVKLEVRATVLK
jgi:hypothetical protein